MLNLVARIGFAVAVALPVYAQAQTGDAPSTPDRNPFRAKTPATKAEEPAVKPVLPGDRPTLAWSDDEVAAAKRDCAKLLSGVTLEYEPLPAVKEGVCGAPAPILVKSIGGVAIEPPATMTCALASGVATWIGKTVQPRARAMLGTQVVKLHNATSYACRNRYGGETTPLSEHALANALDVSEFVFASGEKVTVLASWPRVASAPKTPLQTPTPAATETGSTVPAQPAGPKAIEVVEVTQAKVPVGVNPFATTTKAKTNPFVVPTAVVKAPPPTPPAEAVAPQAESKLPAPSVAELQGQFVKAVHDDACLTFGTVLGPEANEAHKNHFHLDMKARQRSAFCE